MSIKIKFIFVGIVSLLSTVLIGLFLFQNSSFIGKEIEKDRIISAIQSDIFKRAIFRDDYFLHRTERSIIQLQVISKDLDQLLTQASKVFISADEQVSVGVIVDNKKFIDQTLSQIITQPSSELEQQLIGQILIKSQNNITIASKLKDTSRNDVTGSQQRTLLLILIFIFCISLITIVTLYFIWRSIGQPLLALKKIAVRIASLDFSTTTTTTTTTTTPSNDEMGQLARAFNTMVEKLKESYTSLQSANTAIQNVLEDLSIEKIKVETSIKDLEKFKLALDNTSEQVVITDPEGIVIYANRAVEKITGYKPEEAVGKKSGVLWKLPMPKEYYEKLWDTIKKEKKAFFNEIQNKRKNGEVYTAAISIFPLFNKTGEIIYFVSIERDVTKEKNIDKAKTEFVSLASHQLRTPLSTVNWYAEMLLAGDVGKLNEEQKKYLDEVYHGNQRMIELVNALLDVSRIELGTLVIEPKPTDIVKLAESVMDEQKPQIDEKKIILSTLFEKSIPLIQADPKLLRMVVQNLLSNAVKYTSEKGKIGLSLTLNNEKKAVLLKVSDTGYGIPKAQQDKIFTKLFRADNVREKDTDGTGLGLYIVKSILDNSEGSIRFTSEENQGSTFYVTLPIEGMKKKDAKILS